jgi:hypothetical protein
MEITFAKTAERDYEVLVRRDAREDLNELGAGKSMTPTISTLRIER